jgi:ligand-binding SRPBCC domain-containing protein
MFILEKSVIIDCPIEKVFEFHKDINNLRSISPDNSKVKIERVNLPLVKGSDIYLKFTQFFFIKTRWQIRIIEFDPPVKFVDTQIKGPFRSWTHYHLFEEVMGRTKMTDRVEYEMPFGIAGKWIHSLFLHNLIAKTFKYRHRVTKSILNESRSSRTVYH